MNSEEKRHVYNCQEQTLKTKKIAKENDIRITKTLVKKIFLDKIVATSQSISIDPFPRPSLSFIEKTFSLFISFCFPLRTHFSKLNKTPLSAHKVLRKIIFVKLLLNYTEHHTSKTFFNLIGLNVIRLIQKFVPVRLLKILIRQMWQTENIRFSCFTLSDLPNSINCIRLI